jgi:hypothetical protein
MMNWEDLHDELAAWGDADKTATLWWRDDDSKANDHAIADLVALQQRLAVPLSLAVIPTATDQASRQLVMRSSLVSVLQHGYSHHNHAPPDQKKCELAGTRPVEEMLSQLRLGWQCLQALYGRHVLPVLVPPWNRIDDRLITRLPAEGYRGVSLMKSRSSVFAAPGLKQTNTHVDIIDWHGNRRFVGTSAALERIVAHLRARRSGECDETEPTGLLTHHLLHDQKCWLFIEELILRTFEHPSVRWLGAREIFS